MNTPTHRISVEDLRRRVKNSAIFSQDGVWLGNLIRVTKVELAAIFKQNSSAYYIVDFNKSFQGMEEGEVPTVYCRTEFGWTQDVEKILVGGKWEGDNYQVMCHEEVSLVFHLKRYEDLSSEELTHYQALYEQRKRQGFVAKKTFKLSELNTSPTPIQ